VITPKKFVEAAPIQGRVWWFYVEEEPQKTTDVRWSDIVGKPDTFPPSDHTHTWDSIEDKPDFFPTYPAIDTSWIYSSLQDDDVEPLLDDDDAALYDDDSIYDNPPVPTRQFTTVQEMLDEDGSTWDSAMTWNYETGDGMTRYWVMRGDPSLSENSANVRQTTDQYGFAICVAQVF